MKRFLFAIILAVICSSAYAADQLVSRDDLDGSSLGSARGITYTVGRSGQCAVLDAAADTIEYPAERFAQKAGRIEFDVCLTKPLTVERPIWCLFSDVGASGSHYGAINVHWRDKPCQFEYAIFDGSQHHWCYAKDFDWQPGVWHHVALIYGALGMSLEIDGKLQDHNDYTGGLASSNKRVGWHDAYVNAPPVMVDNFRTYSTSSDYLDVSGPLLSPNGDGLLDTCTISYGLADSSTVTLAVVDKNGKSVAKLIDGKQSDAGEYTGSWDGKGIADGQYSIVMSIAGRKQFRQPIMVDRHWKWTKPAPAFNNFFALGTWYFWEDDASYIKRYTSDMGKVKSYYEQTMKDLADHGFNLIVPVWTPHDHRRLQLDTAAKYGIKAIVHMDEINSVVSTGVLPENKNMFQVAEDAIKGVKNHPAVAGYYIIDEPNNSPDMANRIASAKLALETVDPSHPGFSCLLSNYEDLLKTVDYQVLMVDIYPLSPNWSGDWSGYIAQLERGQKNAENRPLWVIMQAFGKPNNSWMIPNAEQIRAQVWLALAHGAKGVLYFIYQSTTGFQGEWLQGLVDMNLKPMDGRLAEVGHINADITKLAPILLKLKPTELDLPVMNDSIVAKPFTDPSGARYAIVVNKDVKQSVAVKWTGAPPTDMLTGLRTRSLLILKPGEGRLLRL